MPMARSNILKAGIKRYQTMLRALKLGVSKQAKVFWFFFSKKNPYFLRLT
jgi:hypothetical protein